MLYLVLLSMITSGREGRDSVHLFLTVLLFYLRRTKPSLLAICCEVDLCWSPRPLVEFSPGNYPYILERCSASIDLPTAITAIFRTREACVLWSCEIVFVFVYVYTHECLVYIDDRGWRLFSKASAYSGGSTGGNSVIDGTMHAISTDSAHVA